MVEFYRTNTVSIETGNWSRVVLVKLTVAQLVKKFPAFYRVQKSPPLVSILRQMNPAQTLLPYFLRSIVILFSHLCLVLPYVLISYISALKMEAVCYSETLT
jgi:hypothetical protein